MRKYRESNLVRAGFIGVTLIILVIAVGLQPERLIQWATSIRHQALFTEAGGITVGNDVTISGIKVGSITEVALDNGDALVTFTTDGKYPLGSQTTAPLAPPNGMLTRAHFQVISLAREITSSMVTSG